MTVLDNRSKGLGLGMAMAALMAGAAGTRSVGDDRRLWPPAHPWRTCACRRTAPTIAFAGANQNARIVTVIATDGAQPPVILKTDQLKTARTGVGRQHAPDHRHLRTRRAAAGLYGPRRRARACLGVQYRHRPDHDHPAARQYPGVQHRPRLFHACAPSRGVRPCSLKPSAFARTEASSRSIPSIWKKGFVRLLDQGGLKQNGIVLGVDGQEIGQTFFEDKRWTIRVKTAEGWRQQSLDAPIDVPFVSGLGLGGRHPAGGRRGRGAPSATASARSRSRTGPGWTPG